MKDTESLIDEGKAQLNKVKTEFDNLSVQFALGKNEAKEAFEREWKNFSGFLDTQAHRLRRQSYWADRLLHELEDRSNALNIALKQKAPTKEKQFNSWRENILRMVYELEFMINELFPVMDAAEKELLSTFRIKMEMYRTRLIMIALSDLATLDNEAKQLAGKAEEILQWRVQDAQKSKEKIQRFGEEIGTSFDHMKKAFSGLFK